ncbi:MAG: type secretion system secreted protein Hcp [Actinomycetota bacterium]|nr:type secretion system secreted protein Hcp [Actinomycetota bacterium]
MALNAYLTLKGQKQGDIKGGVTQKGREGSILVHAVSHQIVSPRDPASGLPTGKRMHKPLVVTKELDKATPLLYRALVANENLVECTLRCWRPSPQGLEQQHFTIKLTNASIASIEFRLPDNRSPDLAKLVEDEEVAITYQKIEWTWVDGGITASDDWQAGP